MIGKLGFRKADAGYVGPRTAAHWIGFGVSAVACSLAGALMLLGSLGFSGHFAWAVAFVPIGVLMIWLFRRVLTMSGSVFHRSTYLLGSRQCAAAVVVAMLAGADMQLLELVFHAFPASVIFALASRFALRGTRWISA